MGLQKINWLQIDTIPPSGSTVTLGDSGSPIYAIYVENLYASDTISGGTFYGDGSGLYNLPTSSGGGVTCSTWKIDANTNSEQDPSSRYFILNNTITSGITEIYIDVVNAQNINVGYLLSTIPTYNDRIYIQSTTNPNEFGIFDITNFVLVGDLTSGYLKFTVTYVDGDLSTLSNNEVVGICFLTSGSSNQNALFNRQNASYQIVLSDVNKVVEMDVETPNNLTVPPNSVVSFPLGAQITITQYGIGQTTILPGAGVTLRSDSGKLKLYSQYSMVALIKIGTDEWYVVGNLDL